MNRVILLGNITKEVELRTTNSGSNIANISIATNESVKNGETWENLTTFHDVIAFGKNAENIAKFFSKGSKILVEGKLSKREWTDKNGVKRYPVEVIVNTFEFVEKKVQKENDYSQEDNNHDYSQEESFKENEIKVEDIPF